MLFVESFDFAIICHGFPKMGDICVKKDASSYPDGEYKEVVSNEPHLFLVPA